MKKRREPDHQGNLVRSVRWNGLCEGDVVHVDGPKERRQHWVFIAHVRNEVTNEEWIDVRGGRTGEAKNRSFRPEQIYPAHAKKGARFIGRSLAEAPQLQIR